MRFSLKWLFLLLPLLFFLRPTLVVTSDWALPVNDADVTYRTTGWNGCLPASSHKTFFGFTISSGMFLPCHVAVKKDGYYSNGLNEYPFLLPVYLIRLQKITDIESPVIFTRKFTSLKNGMDVLSYLHDVSGAVTPENMLGDKENDFSFTTISNESSDVIGRPILHMKFSGQGGAQPISGDMHHDAYQDYYDLANLVQAPMSGYQNDLSVESGKAYVARLRDGKHYMKFRVVGEKERNIENIAIITAYVQPDNSRHLAFGDISFEAWNTNERNMPDYNLKRTYFDLQKSFPRSVRIDSYQGFNRRDAIGERVLIPENYNPNDLEHKATYFVQSPDGLLPPPQDRNAISMDKMKGKSFRLVLPPFHLFQTFDSNTAQVPVYVYDGDKLIHPDMLKLPPIL